MKAIFIKEIRYFFTSSVGIVVLLLFLTTNALVLFVFEGEQNLFQRGLADIYPFFELSSWIFIGIIPALTMRSFSYERQLGTLSLLYTRPLSVFDIVFGKYLSVLFFVLVMIIPTFIYVWIVNSVVLPGQWIDGAVVVGSYMALFLLSTTCASIGIWASSLTEHQIVAFVLGVFVCFMIFYGMDRVSGLWFSIDRFGMKYHFDAISRGVVGLSDVVYFLSLDVFFIVLTLIKLQFSRV